ncbi:uncharacterized protein CANTADRAFT_27692 [Suhomyces tanzawaensis NRRL Y-17324]|uniref:Chitin biosynthesis protein CHS5 n=1 Tax=Suhomyces tanzawaensis NRRL Y-17324 TaxID=984487 RepID=A0A1E4SAX7_9ASCO|nr:uncharacterized protein CANTADRAFT_27692 [Suhomyces tanzawaensis NRRL Y-17324]ODV76651.1 hypothetical protein CANTADRAFT_27692 [Suhomyces tanzawaensis NRRL Y-17324]
MVEVSLTVGKLDASLALLLTKDHHLIEFPTILLPNGVKAGSIVKIKCDQDLETEVEEAKQFQKIQDEILTTFGTNLPQSPVLKIKNITQTSCILEWDKLELGTSSLKNLILFKDGKKLGSIPQPLTNRTTKLSGLPIDKSFNFQLRLDTTAGIYLSNTVEVTTHKMTDLSGITVCVGDFSPNDPFTLADIENTLKKMGANYPPQDKIKVDTTHFICTRENKQNPEYLKASDMNIPIIRPEWLKACERERRIVGVRDFYIKDCVLPDIFAKNYWGNKQEQAAVAAPAEPSEQPVKAPEESSEQPVTTPEEGAHISVEDLKQKEELPPLPQEEAKATKEEEVGEKVEETKLTKEDAGTAGELEETKLTKQEDVEENSQNLEEIDLATKEEVAESAQNLEEVDLTTTKEDANLPEVDETVVNTEEIKIEEPPVEEPIVEEDPQDLANDTAKSNPKSTSVEQAASEVESAQTEPIETIPVKEEPVKEEPAKEEPAKENLEQALEHSDKETTEEAQSAIEENVTALPVDSNTEPVEPEENTNEDGLDDEKEQVGKENSSAPNTPKKKNKKKKNKGKK